MQSHYLNPLFSPRSIAMFGASERKNSVGEVVFRNLLAAGFKGAIYPINPKHDSIQGKKAYKTIDAIGKPVDLAVVATPAKTIPAIVEACGQQGVKSMIILSAGFLDIDFGAAHQILCPPDLHVLPAHFLPVKTLRNATVRRSLR